MMNDDKEAKSRKKSAFVPAINLCRAYMPESLPFPSCLCYCKLEAFFSCAAGASDGPQNCPIPEWPTTAKAFYVSPGDHSRGRLVLDQQPDLGLQVDVVGAFRDGAASSWVVLLRHDTVKACGVVRVVWSSSPRETPMLNPQQQHASSVRHLWYLWTFRDLVRINSLLSRWLGLRYLHYGIISAKRTNIQALDNGGLLILELNQPPLWFSVVFRLTTWSWALANITKKGWRYMKLLSNSNQ